MDDFNNASRDEDNILDQISINQICSYFYYDVLKYLYQYTKKHTNIGVAQNPKFMSSKCCILMHSYNMHFFNNS